MKTSILSRLLFIISVMAITALSLSIFFELRKERGIEVRIKEIDEINESLACGEGRMMDMEGNEYETVKIDFQCWMAENIKTTVDFRGLEIERYCYNDDLENCQLYGGLYSWENAAVICPSGWRLPGDEDFKELEMVLGMEREEIDTTGWRGAPMGDLLKDISWDGTGEFGFNALPGGFRSLSGGYQGIGKQAYFWGTAFSEEESWRRFFYSEESGIFRGFISRDFAFSVRCIKNY